MDRELKDQVGFADILCANHSISNYLSIYVHVCVSVFKF